MKRSKFMKNLMTISVILLIILSLFIGYSIFAQSDGDNGIEIRFMLRVDNSNENEEYNVLYDDENKNYYIEETFTINDEFKLGLTFTEDGKVTIDNITPDNDLVEVYPGADGIEVKANQEKIVPEGYQWFTFLGKPGREILQIKIETSSGGFLGFLSNKEKKLYQLILNTKSESEDTEDDVTTSIFKDPNLEKAVREHIGKLEGDLTLKELESITELEAESMRIESLEGLENLSNLTSLNLFNNNIEDISPVLYLVNLTKLDLSDNRIEDITPISTLKYLTKLSLVKNFITDISPISGLSKLTQLNLYGNRISDIKPLSELYNLEMLSLPLNKIYDINPLKTLINLKELYLHTNHIEYIAPLVNLKKLEILHLSYNKKIEDLSPLKDLTNLTELYLYDNSIKDISSLINLSRINVLILGDNRIKDITPLRTLHDNGGLPEDSELNITNNNMNLRPHTPNRDTVNYLIGKGVIIEYEKGNNVK
jgi:Leucine-rich repeat (LRR) protein